MAPNGSSRTFVYDGENKQVEIKNSSNVTVGLYYYDGDGKRVKKVVPNGETTIFVYDAVGKLVAEYSTNINTTPEVTYLTNDTLGSPRINTNENGAVIARHDYHPFGEEINTSPRTIDLNYTQNDRRDFTGYTEDGETDLQYTWARYYSKMHARFQTPDPFLGSMLSANPQSWNRYSYSSNDPINQTDRLGLTWLRKGSDYFWVDDKDYEKTQKNGKRKKNSMR